MINFRAIGAKINEGLKIGEGESYESRMTCANSSAAAYRSVATVR
jgi:hypothetical protein